MEVLQSTAKMQQSQMAMPKSGGVEAPGTQNVQQMQQSQMNENKPSEKMREAKVSGGDYQKEMEKLVLELNRSLNPFNTSLRFGFDSSSEDFYVSVIDTKTNNMIRRFPAEEAQVILPKMQEINGLLFDESV
ncbi:MAG: flagellar protein FlaG [Campylobacterota bacterium]